MSAAATTNSRASLPPGGYRSPEAACSLAEVLDRILHLGVSLEGNLTISLANVDLLYLDLRLLLASVDTVWPEGRPVFSAAPTPDDCAPSSSGTLPPPSPALGVPENRPQRVASPAEAAGPPPVTPAAGLVRLVLTLVKVLHDVLERQAVRRMDGGRLTAAQIEDVGAGLLAQSEEIERLREHFGFADRDIALKFGLSDRSI